MYTEMSHDGQVYLPMLTRKVNLSEWFLIDGRKPEKGQRVTICDADRCGFADYELSVTWDGEGFMLEGIGHIAGAIYWKPEIKMRKAN